MSAELKRSLLAEFLGTAILLATIIGAGIMADRLEDGDLMGLVIGSTLAIGAILVVIITIFGPVSGAHFNPAVSMVMWWRGALPARYIAPYITTQIIGAVVGTVAANLMFDLAPITAGTTVRTGPGMMLSEIVATFGLVLVVLGGVKVRADAVPWLVGLYITAAIWFTQSTAFANPAVTIGRAFSATPSSITPADVGPFIMMQYVGAAIAVLAAAVLWPDSPEADIE